MKERISASSFIRFPTEPEPISVDLLRSSVIVVDMQNVFLSPGGMFDIIGFNVLKFRRIIKPVKNVLDYSRKLGLKIIYLRQAYSPDLSDSGGPESPSYWKVRSLVLLREKPDLKDKSSIKGAWGAEIIDEVKPLPEEPVIDKQRYSGFVNTKLEEVLRNMNIKYLFFVGIFLNVCVESTIRDAFFRDFWPIVISDCCEAVGSKYAKNVSLWNISNLFGWTITSRKYIRALKKEAAKI
ncbi:MAG: cysteine hydrolase [Candidatus Bathyarchaeia archaeon]